MRRRALAIGTALVGATGAALLAKVTVDDVADGRGRQAREQSAPADDTPLAPLVAEDDETPEAARGRPGSSAPAAVPAAEQAPKPSRASRHARAASVAVAIKEAASRPGHSAAAASGPAAHASPSAPASGSAPAHPDAGAPAAQRASPDGGTRAGPAKVAAASKSEQAALDDRSGDFVRVARFVPTGGALLQGRVVDADNGRPVIGAVVEAVLAERFMEGRTDGNGAFQMAGMAPATRVRVWIGGKHDPFVAERIDVGIPGEGQVADAGVVRLLRGDELAGRLDGWVGLFVARRGSRVIVSAVSPWLPADLAGIIVGDVLVSIDGREVGGFGPRAVAFLMRGPPKTSAALVIEAHDGTRRKLILERVLR